MTDTERSSLWPPDQGARAKIANDLDDNILVDAGPGSGKTTELVSRMVALIESGKARPEDIAAVTFTKKAARELRERFQARIDERLAQERKADKPDYDSQERLEDALATQQPIFIGTIHGFCARILREAGVGVGLDPSFEVLPESELLSSRERFFTAYLERLTRENDSGLESLVHLGVRPLDLFELFGKVVEYPDVELPADDAELPSRSDFTAIRKELGAIIDQAWELMPELEPDRGWDPLQNAIRKLHYIREVEDWDDPHLSFQALSILCKPDGSAPGVTQNRWKEKKEAKNLHERVEYFGRESGPARELVNLWYQRMYALVLQFVLDARDEFSEYRTQNGKLEFQDLLFLSARLLRSDPKMRRYFGERYRRLLVDEFQDTDPLQAEIVLLLASEPPAESEGENTGVYRNGWGGWSMDVEWRGVEPRPGALFVVGDSKQSIYRSRRADIQLYDFVKERFQDFGSVIQLTANFRSSPAIGDFVNKTFSLEGLFPPSATLEQAGFEPLNTKPSKTEPGGVFMYEVQPPQNTPDARALDDAGRIAAWIRERIDNGERKAEDFLILTIYKGRLSKYARALEEQNLPAQVTGARVEDWEEIQELRVVLECMVDPTNPVKVTAALVGLFFGIDYDRLVAHRLDGGSFDVMRLSDQGHSEVLEALDHLHKWWVQARSQPADVFISGLTSELGLIPYASASELGSLRAGTLVYILNEIRAAALAGNTSLPAALEALKAALDSGDAEVPLEPGKRDVIRVMNVHQAKGLEAPVVVLAEPSGRRPNPIKQSVSRPKDGPPVGFFRVDDLWGRRLVQPRNWENLERYEKTLQDAEEVRLVYVAATRAKEELLVARREGGKDTSVWKVLHPGLDKWATRLNLGLGSPLARDSVDFTPDQTRQAGATATERLAELAAPSFTYSTVTEVAKDNPHLESPKPILKEADTDQVFRGFAWGNVVHAALAAAASEPSADALYATCRDLLIEYDRPLDDHGDPVELDELLELVNRIRASDLWIRAQGAERVLAEVSFAAPGFVKQTQDSAEESDIPGKPGLSQSNLFEDEMESSDEQDDSAEEDTPSSTSHVLEGVIDLAFLEHDGWVIADYKTDVGTDPDFAMRSRAYRQQVDLYADAWTQLTGEAVKERVLFFTAQDRIESW